MQKLPDSTLNTQHSTRKRDNFIWAALIILTLLRLGIFTRAPYNYVPGSGHDDMNLLNIANSILKTGWLGNYYYLLLIKGVSFPIFVFISNLLYMPYGFALGLFYIVASGVFCSAVCKISKSLGLAALSFLWLIYSPMSFGYISSRIYRMAIIFPAVILVLGCLLMVYYNRTKSIIAQITWLIWTGLSFAFFYYIREDSMWLLPLFIACLIFCAIWNIYFSGLAKKRALVYLLPICVFLLVNIAYKSINYNHYGIFEVNDRTHGPFATLTGNMIKIKDTTQENRNLWISRKKFEKIIDSCPSLAKNKDAYLSSYNRWLRILNQKDNIMGDHSIWAFREGLNKVGYYSSATKADAFCKQVNQELLQAIKSGIFEFDDAFHISTQCRGLYADEFVLVLKETAKNLFNVSTFKDVAFALHQTGEGLPDETKWVEAFTGVHTILRAGLCTRAAGWLIWKDNESGGVWLRLRDQQGHILADNITLYNRPDVRAAFPNYIHSDLSGFTFLVNNGTDLNKSVLQVFSSDNKLLKEVSFANYDDSDLAVTIDVVEKDIAYDQIYAYAQNYERFFSAFIAYERQISVVLFALMLIIAVYLWLRFVFKRTWANFEAAIILTGFISSGFILEFGVTLFTTWIPSAVSFYSAGVPAMIQASEILSIFYFIKSLKKSD